jgi:hypothetical protein
VRAPGGGWSDVCTGGPGRTDRVNTLPIRARYPPGHRWRWELPSVELYSTEEYMGEEVSMGWQPAPRAPY